MTTTSTSSAATGRAPRGWDKLVAQLNAAPDLATFHRGMLDLQCKIVAAEYGALWVLDPNNEPRPLEMWPERVAKAAPDSPLMSVLTQAAKAGFERSVSHVLKLEAETADNSGELGAHVFVTALRVKGRVAAITTVVAETRDNTVLQQTAPLRELAAGLYEGFFSRQESLQREADAARIRQSLAILAVGQEAEGFKGAALNLVNELARQLKCTRVSLGWIKGRGIKLIAMSDTEHLKRVSEQVGVIELAMAECLDQQQPIVYPVPANAEPLLQQAVVHSHRKVTDNQPNRHVLSLPLRHRDEWIGVITLERSDEAFDPALIQYLQLVVDVVAPLLDDRRAANKLLVGHTWTSVEKTSAYLVGSRHVGWKLGALVALAVLVSIFFVKWNYKVSAPCVLEARKLRIVPAPFEGRLDAVYAEPGKHVRAGDKLAEFETRELRLRLAKAQAEFNKKSFEQSQHMTEGKRAEAAQAKAEMDAYAADINLLNYQLEHATLKAPVDGWVINKQWKDKIGSVVKQGEPMYEVAPIGDLVARMNVGESDINHVDMDANQKGAMTTRSQPMTSFNLRTYSVVPAAAPVNGTNSFEVRGQLDLGEYDATRAYREDDVVIHQGHRYRARKDNGPETRVGPVKPPQVDTEGKSPSDDPGAKFWESADWLRPGMEGLAKIEVGPKPIAWILTHRIADTVRLWFWW